jgi:hypothetical protein
MIKAKLSAARTREDVLQLIQTGSGEFHQPGLVIRLPDSPFGTALDLQSGVARFNSDLPTDSSSECLHDIYRFHDTGLVVDAYVDPENAGEELLIEHRRLFGEICLAANQRLAALVRNGDSVPRWDGATAAHYEGTSAHRHFGG